MNNRETKEEEKNRLRNQMREAVLEPEDCEDKYNISLFGRKIDLDYREQVHITIPQKIDHWLRNWAKANDKLVSKRLELFLKSCGALIKLSRQPNRHKESDAHAIRWHYHNGDKSRISKLEAIYTLCKVYREKVSDEIKDEYLEEFPHDPLRLFEAS